MTSTWIVTLTSLLDYPSPEIAKEVKFADSLSYCGEHFFICGLYCIMAINHVHALLSLREEALPFMTPW